MWCIIHKVSDDFYRAYTNVIFDTKDNADFFAKKSKFKKKDDCRVVKYDYKYFAGVTENEIKH